MDIERGDAARGERSRPTDDERAEVARDLEHAVGNGQLSLDEYIDRVDSVFRVHDHAALAELTADLAGPLVGATPARVPTSIAVFEDVVRSGRWRLPASSRAVAVFGDVELDLREVTTTDTEIHITATAVFGDIRITVPEGVEVVLEADAALSHAHTCRLAEVPRRRGTPLVRVHPAGWFGNVHIASRTSTEPRLSTRMQEAWQRWRSRHDR